MTDERIRTYQVSGGWSVSECGTWVDGVYETQAAAIMAVDADVCAIAELAARHKIITEAEVIALRLAEQYDDEDEDE